MLLIQRSGLFDPVISEPRFILRWLLKSVHNECSKTDCSVCSCDAFKFPNVPYLRHPCNLIYSSPTYACRFTKLYFYKADFADLLWRIPIDHLQLGLYNKLTSFSANYNVLRRFSITLCSSLCILPDFRKELKYICLCTNYDTVTAGLYSLQGYQRYTLVRALQYESCQDNS